MPASSILPAGFAISARYHLVGRRGLSVAVG
jgi:hypothetical protein